MSDEPLVIEFTFYGRQYTAGSKTAMPVFNEAGELVRNPKTGRTITRVKHASDKTAPWMALVTSEAAKAYRGPLLTGAIKLTIEFLRPRPKGHYGTGRNEGKLKDSAPEFHTIAPDTLKLGRAIEDALTGVIWKDDAQINRHVLSKDFGPRYTTIVRIEALEAKFAGEEGEDDAITKTN